MFLILFECGLIKYIECHSFPPALQFRSVYFCQQGKLIEGIKHLCNHYAMLTFWQEIEPSQVKIEGHVDWWVIRQILGDSLIPCPFDKVILVNSNQGYTTCRSIGSWNVIVTGMISFYRLEYNQEVIDYTTDFLSHYFARGHIF